MQSSTHVTHVELYMYTYKDSGTDGRDPIDECRDDAADAQTHRGRQAAGRFRAMVRCFGAVGVGRAMPIPRRPHRSATPCTVRDLVDAVFGLLCHRRVVTRLGRHAGVTVSRSRR